MSAAGKMLEFRREHKIWSLVFRPPTSGMIAQLPNAPSVEPVSDGGVVLAYGCITGREYRVPAGTVVIGGNLWRVVRCTAPTPVSFGGDQITLPPGDWYVDRPGWGTDAMVAD